VGAQTFRYASIRYTFLETRLTECSVSLRQASVDLGLKSTPLSAELRKNIDMLTQETADESVLRRLAVICSENGHSSATDAAASGQASPEFSPSSPTHTNGNSIARPLTSPADIWLGGKLFDKLFDALTAFLTHDKVGIGLPYPYLFINSVLCIVCGDTRPWSSRYLGNAKASVGICNRTSSGTLGILDPLAICQQRTSESAI
jgi:hypothetical protein